jgi:hypothetical protein
MAYGYGLAMAYGYPFSRLTRLCSRWLVVIRFYLYTYKKQIVLINLH